MNLWSVLLAIYHPCAVVARILHAAQVTLMRARSMLTHDWYREGLTADYEQLAFLDKWLANLESLLHIAIWHMARYRLGLPFREHRRPGLASPVSSLTLASIHRRLAACEHLLMNIERLAIRRAVRLARLLDAEPLGLEPAHPVDASCAAPVAAPAAFRAPAQAFADPRIRAPP
jgi:hypothetical protein